MNNGNQMFSSMNLIRSDLKDSKKNISIKKKDLLENYSKILSGESKYIF